MSMMLIRPKLKILLGPLAMDKQFAVSLILQGLCRGRRTLADCELYSELR